MSRRLYLWVALIVLAPRVAFLAVAPERNIYGNADGMFVIADNLIAGKGFVLREGKPDDSYSPVYPFFLAGCRGVAGKSVLAPKILQIGCDIGSALLLSWLMASFLPAGAILCFAGVFAVHPVFLHYVNNINQEPLLMFLVVSSLVTSYRAVMAPSFGRFALAAILIALATLTRGSPILLPLGLAGVFVIWKRNVPLKFWALYLGVYVATLFPWAYRNYEVFGRFSVGVGGYGNGLWWGSDPRIFTAYGEQRRRVAAEAELEFRAKGVQRPDKRDIFADEQYRFELAIENYKEMLRHPGYGVKVLAMKLTRSLYATEERPSAHLPLILIQTPVIMLALLGMVRTVKNPGTKTLAMVSIVYIAYFYLIVSVSMPMLRYFSPVLPVMLMLATVGAFGRNLK